MFYTVVPEFPSLYQIETKVRAGLHTRLPGSDAHLALAPRPRLGWHPGEVPRGARIAAGLVLIYPHDVQPHIVLTVRAGRLAQHPGQVSLPGGGLKPGETVDEAALREASEEVGINRADVRLLGLLSALYIPVSDFALHPVVGITETRPSFHAEENEVDRMLEVSLDELATTGGPRRGYRWRRDELFQVPFFELGGERVWGATAMVLAELLAVIGTPVLDPFAGPLLNSPH